MTSVPAAEPFDGLARRTVLKALGGTVVGAAMAPVAATMDAERRVTGGDARGLSTALHFSSATALARVICTRQLSAEEVVRAFFARILAVNPRIHGVVQVQWEGAIEQARAADARLLRGEPFGQLHGVPITIKDSLDTAGIVAPAT